MQIMTIFIDQFLLEKSEIDGKANTLAMVFVRYTMDHDSRAYGTRIHDPWYIYSFEITLSTIALIYLFTGITGTDRQHCTLYRHIFHVRQN